MKEMEEKLIQRIAAQIFYSLHEVTNDYINVKLMEDGGDCLRRRKKYEYGSVS